MRTTILILAILAAGCDLGRDDPAGDAGSTASCTDAQPDVTSVRYDAGPPDAEVDAEIRE